MELSNLKTHVVANTGVVGGSATIITALVALVAFLSNTDNLYNIVIALIKLKHGQDLNETDMRALVSAIAVCVGFFGAIAVFLLAAWLGKSPLNRTPDPPASKP